MKFNVSTFIFFLAWLAVSGAQGQTKYFSDPQKLSYLSIQVLRGNVIVVGTSDSSVTTNLGLWPSELTKDLIAKGFSRSRKQSRRRAEFSMRGTEGEIDVECLQGKIFLDRIRGPVVAHTLNQSLEARFSALVPGKPNFLSSLNGDVRLFLPKDSDVSFELDFFNGEVVTSMPITLLPLAKGKTPQKKSDFEAPSTAETARKATHFQIKTHNGNIHIDNYHESHE